jgi:hypothetical protein
MRLSNHIDSQTEVRRSGIGIVHPSRLRAITTSLQNCSHITHVPTTFRLSFLGSNDTNISPTPRLSSLIITPSYFIFQNLCWLVFMCLCLFLENQSTRRRPMFSKPSRTRFHGFLCFENLLNHLSSHDFLLHALHIISLAFSKDQLDTMHVFAKSFWWLD